MRYLTTFLDDEINFKFGNKGSIIKLKASDDHTVVSFTDEDKIAIKIKDSNSYIDTIPVEPTGKAIMVPTKKLAKLPVGEYEVELWHGDGEDTIIYPDEGFLKLRINQNASQFNGEKVSTITLVNFEAKFDELYKRIEDKLKALPDIDENFNLDISIKDGRLIINGKDVGIDFTTLKGKDGHDGHTPEITVSDAGTLVIDGVDTNKSLIGPRGENGLPGKDGENGLDGKSAYELAVANGFSGSESEWLASLHGRDGIDGKPGQDGTPGEKGEQGLPGKDGQPGRDGRSAYQVAIDNGFDGTEVEWLRSLHGEDGADGAPGQNGKDGVDGSRGEQGPKGEDGKSAYEIAMANGFKGNETEWLRSLKGKDADPAFALNTVRDKSFWGDPKIQNSFDPQINIVATKPLKVGNLSSIIIDNVVSPGKVAIGVGNLEGNTYTFLYCKMVDLSVGDTVVQLDWVIPTNDYYLFVSGNPFQTRGNGDADAGSKFKYMIAETRSYNAGNKITVDGESLGNFKYNFVLNYTSKTRINLEQIIKNTMPYANKKIAFLGDSITSGGMTSNGKQAFSYVDCLKDYLGAEIANYGLSGSVIVAGNVENQTQPFVSRAGFIWGQDFVTIFGGINDFWFNSPLGSMEDGADNVKTFYGALKYLIEKLSNNNPNAHFLFVTPLKERKDGAPHTYEDNNKFILHKNRAGFTEEDYVNAIKEVAAYYSVPVLDLFNSSNMNPYIESQRQYFADDLHPNQLGAQRLALLISQAINNGISSGYPQHGDGAQGGSDADGPKGHDGLSAYEIAKKNGFVGTEQEWLESLHAKDAKATRHGPTSWVLDRSTYPWTIWFDNGCGLQMPSYATTPTVYGYGFGVNPRIDTLEAYPVLNSIMGAAHGYISLDSDRIKKRDGGADYWADDMRVLNPINEDAKDYDWSNVFCSEISRSKRGFYVHDRQKNFFRVCYELGIFTIKDIIPFGLTKKEGK